MEFMRRCILSFFLFFFFLVWGGGSPTWDNRLGGNPQGGDRVQSGYNVLLFLFLFFIPLLFIACTTTPLSPTGIIYTKNPKSRSTLLHCITIASALSCILPPPFSELTNALGWTCVTTFELRLSHGFWSPASWDMPPQNVTHHNPRGSRSLVPGSLQTDLSGRLSGSNVEQIGPLADIEHGWTVLFTRLASELSTFHT